MEFSCLLYNYLTFDPVLELQIHLLPAKLNSKFYILNPKHYDYTVSRINIVFWISQLPF